MFKSQKGSKDIVIQLSFYEGTRILFVRKQNQQTTLFNNSSLPYHSPLRIHDSTMTHVCGAADIEHTCTAACLQAEECTHMLCVALLNSHLRLMRKRRNC